MLIDENVQCKNSNFKFDKDVVNIFDSHVRKSVPMYDEFHKLIVDLSDWFVEDHTNVYDLGTSTGECIKNIYNKHKIKQINYIGVDNSLDMVNRAKENLKDTSISILKEDVTLDDFKISNASLITSVLMLQFIPLRKRKHIIEKVYNGLNDGGAFIIIEKIVGNNARFDEMFIELYHDMKIENGLSEKEVFSKSRAIRGAMRPNTVNENIEILKNIGFKDVDIFFKWCNFVGFVAVK